MAYETLQGTWLSVYSYSSGELGETTQSTHQMKAKLDGHRLTLHSEPDETGSVVTVELLLENSIATGAWREHTSPTGKYAGKEFFGGIQLWLSEDGQILQGKWVGFGSKPGEINTGEWTFTKQTVPATA